MDSEEDDLYSFEAEIYRENENKPSQIADRMMSMSSTSVRGMNIESNYSRISSRTAFTLSKETLASHTSGSKTRLFSSRLGTTSSWATARQSGTSNIVSADTAFTRPMTSITSAGYRPSSRLQTSTTFRPGTSRPKSCTIENVRLDPDETPMMKIRKLKEDINEVVDKSAELLSKGDKTSALDQGMKASEMEKSLVQLETDTDIHHDWNVTFVVIYNLGLIYENMQKYDDALPTYSSLLIEKFSSQEGQVRFNIGNIYLKQKEYSAAIKSFRTTLDKIGDTNKNLRIKLLFYSGITFLKMDKAEEAITCFESIMLLKPNIRAGFQLVMANCIEKDSRGAKTSFILLLDVPVPMSLNITQPNGISCDQLTELCNNDFLAQYEKDFLAFAEKCVLTAGRLIAPMIENTVCDGYDWVLKTLRKSNYGYLAPALEVSKSLVILKQGNSREAIELLETVTKNSPRFLALAATNLCYLYFLQGDLKKGIENGKRAVYGNHGDSYNSAGFINLGNCHLAEGDIELAAQLFKEGLSLDSTCIEGMYNMGLLTQKIGQFKDALRWFYKILKQIPTFADVIFQIASTLEMRKEFKRAFDWYNKALALSPNDPEILFRLGVISDTAEGDKRQAYQYFCDAFRYNPTDLDVVKWLLNYVSCYHIRLEEATKYFRQGIQLDPNNPYWTKTLAICYKRIGEFDRALDLLRKAHVTFPNDMQILEELSTMTSGFDNVETLYYENKLEKLMVALKTPESDSTPPNTSAQGESDDADDNCPIVNGLSQELDAISESKIVKALKTHRNTSRNPRPQTKFMTPRIPIPVSDSDYTSTVGTGEDEEEDLLDKFFENADITSLLTVEAANHECEVEEESTSLINKYKSN